MNLFERVPARLFSVLASPGREVYAHVLFLIYGLFREMRFGIPREVAVDAATAFLEGQVLAPDALSELGEDGVADARQKAQAVLRRLRDDRWLELEVRTNYEEYVNLYDYSIQVLEVLDRIRTQRRAEYAGYVYGTYAALAVAEADRQGAMALERAYDQTEQLVRELQSLQHNIRQYTERLVRQHSPREILAIHFLEYKEQVLDRSYHQLRTSDHVSKYRPRILEKVEQWLHEPGRVEQVAREEARRHGLPLEEAEGVVRSRLQSIHTAYAQMDDLLDEIDRRNAQYAKASLEQVRYLLNPSKDTEGQLVDLLALLAAELSGGGLRADESLPAPWEALFRLFPVQTLEPTSRYRPRQTRDHRPQPLDVSDPAAPERAAVRAQTRARLTGRLTAARIEEWVLGQMGDRAAVQAADLQVADIEGFIRLIYAGSLGRSRRVQFTVDYRGEPTAAAGGRFRFKNVTLRRK